MTVKTSLKPRSVFLSLFPVLLIAVAFLIVTRKPTAHKTAQPFSRQVTIDVRSAVPGIQIVSDVQENENLLPRAYNALGGPNIRRMTLKNVSTKPIAFVFVRLRPEPSSGRIIPLNFMENDDDGAFDPNQEVVLDRSGEETFVVAAATFKDGTSEGEDFQVARVSQEVREWKQGAAKIKAFLKECRANLPDEAQVRQALKKALEDEQPHLKTTGTRHFNQRLRLMLDNPYYAPRLDTFLAQIERNY